MKVIFLVIFIHILLFLISVYKCNTCKIIYYFSLYILFQSSSLFEFEFGKKYVYVFLTKHIINLLGQDCGRMINHWIQVHQTYKMLNYFVLFLSLFFSRLFHCISDIMVQSFSSVLQFLIYHFFYPFEISCQFI